MPSAGEIRDSLTTISNAWDLAAVLWHAYFAAIFAVLVSRWRPSKRVFAALLVPPAMSVGVLAWLGDNPFNGSIFTVLSLWLAWLAFRQRREPIALASGLWIAVGALFSAFGWAYPHFLEAESALAYMYAAPLGLVPCPTLSMLIGVSFVLDGMSSRAWILVLAVAGLFYGAFGALYLGVTMDWVLAAAALSAFWFVPDRIRTMA